MIFFENERACWCVWIDQKFAITYTYTWFNILWWIFRDFFRNFSKNRHFWKFWGFLEKVTPGPPGVDILGKSASKIGKKGVKIRIYGTNDVLTSIFRTFYPILGSPRGWSEFCIFQNVKNFQKSWFCKIHKNGISEMWFFSKMNVPEGVNRESENLISRIPIHDLKFCDELFLWFLGIF